ncbi:MAG: hypothetical protein MJ240_07040 [Kiritimatiellae bacterium]|nr:hypothetical protein [Kiritimatiellia bacterium]
MNADKFVSLVVVAASLGVAADVANTFSDQGQTWALLANGTTTFTAATSKQATLPTDLGNPIFWFDCANTNGWTLDGANVLKVPDRVAGSTRYLTSDKNDPNFDEFSWKGFGYPKWQNAPWVTSPTLSSPAAGLAGHGVLDFGAQQSQMGLIFDLWRPDESCVKSNVLANIGTVFAVYDSTAGGGFFLGGGFKLKGTGYNWHRAGQTILKRGDPGYIDGDAYFYSNPLLNSHAFTEARWGCFREDGLAVSPDYVGFGGGWQVISMCPTAAGMEATGLGCADLRSFDNATWARRSGGMRIAEMIFFDKVLSVFDIARVEAYLNEKWFGVKPRGWNGNAVLDGLGGNARTDAAPTAPSIVIEAAAGETARITRLSGGHMGGSLVKTGEGTLALGTARDMNTVLSLQGGDLKFLRRALPVNLPTNYIFRLDATRTDLIEKDEAGRVSRVDNVGGHAYYGRDLYLRTPTDIAAAPVFLADALGSGKPVLDFGANIPYTAAGPNGAYMDFATNTTEVATYPTVGSKGVCSIVAVVGAQLGGGQLVSGKGFYRAALTTRSHTTGLLRSDPTTFGATTYNATDGMVYIDGIRRAANQGYPTPGYHVVAMRVPYCGEVLGVGGVRKANQGGARIAELVIYDRVLSDEELRDAGAFLMDKWFGRVPGDYAPRTVDAFDDLPNLDVSVPTTIDVPSNAVATIGRIRTLKKIVKTGGGTLRIREMADAGQMLEAAEGKVDFVSPTDVTAADELPAGASFHLDAANLGSMDFTEQDGKKFVSFWHSEDFRNLAYGQQPGRHPWLTSVADGLNGHAVVDFGEGGDVTAPFMVFGQAVLSIKSAYVVWRPASNRAFLLGSSTAPENMGGANNLYDFHRYDTNGGIFRNDLFESVLTNGVAVSRTGVVMPPEQWRLVEAHAYADDSGGLGASALACDRDWGTGKAVVDTRYGGQRVAEVLLYERELTEREKVAARNYLLKKWFPESPQAELPEAPAEEDRSLYALTVAAGEQKTVDVDAAYGKLLGEGTVAVSDATLSCRDLSSFSGTVAVASGTFRITGTPSTADELVEGGLLYHADATWGVVTTPDAQGNARVTEWKSRLDDGWTAVPPFGESEACRPTLLSNGLNGRAVVDMAVPLSTNNLQCLRFKKDGEWANLSGIGSIFWVFGSQNGGGYVLGGGTNSAGAQIGCSFLRDFNGDKRTSRKTDNILAASARDHIRWGGWWYKNGEFFHYSTGGSCPKFGLSGGWDLLEWNSRTYSTYQANCDGFAFDGSVLRAARTTWRATGQQRLAEVIFYNRSLTDAERAQNRNYLSRKWGLGVQEAAVNAATVTLAAGATLDCGGTNQYVHALGGSGTVVGDISVGQLLCDYAEPAVPSVTGTFLLPTALQVVLANFPQSGLRNVSVKLLEAGAIDGQENLSAVVFAGQSINPAYRPKVQVKDGALMLGFSSIGTTILFR